MEKKQIHAIVFCFVLLLVSAIQANAYSTFYLLEDNIEVSSQMWFTSPTGVQHWSESYSGKSMSEENPSDVGAYLDKIIYEEINGETEFFEHHAGSSFRGRTENDSIHIEQDTYAGINDQSYRGPDYSLHAEALMSLDWRFRIEGTDAMMSASLVPYGGSTTDFWLFDETENMIAAEMHRSGVTVGHIREFQLYDSHIYSMVSSTFTTEEGFGDPMSRIELTFYNSLFAVPVPPTLFLLSPGLFIAALIGLFRRFYNSAGSAT